MLFVLKVCNRTNTGKRVNRYNLLQQRLRELGYFVGSDKQFTYINFPDDKHRRELHLKLQEVTADQSLTFMLCQELVDAIEFSLKLINDSNVVLASFVDLKGTTVSAMEFIHNKGFNNLNYCVDYYGKKPNYYRVST